MRFPVLPAILLFSLLSIPLAQAADPVRFFSSAEVEIQTTNAKGEKVLTRRPAEKVPPGGIVIYVNTFSNTGQESREKLVISSPIPADTEFVPGSASTEGAEVTYSSNRGKTFAPAAMLRVPDDKGGERPAVARDYTNVRWQMKNPLKPGETGSVEFRVRVK